jgi:tetratricopeptide (TPR) repeat protein
MTKRAKIAFCAAAAVFLLLSMVAALGAYYALSFYLGRHLFDEGCAAMARQDYDTAVSRFDSALRQRLVSAYRAYAFQNLAFSENAKGRHDEAIRDYTQALRLDPLLAFAHSARGALYDDKGERDKAFNDYSEAIRLDPNDNRALFRRGYIDLERKDWDKAIADFSEAIRTSPSSETSFFERGVAYSHTNDLDRALASFESAIRLWPSYATAYVQRGYIYKRKHELEKALADFTEAIRINPKYELAYRARAFAFSENKRWPEAIADFSKTLEINPKDNVAFEGRGYAHSEAGDQDHAIADFTEMIRIKKSTNAYRCRAGAYSRKGDYAHALVDLREATKAAPDESTAFTNLAWFLATCADPFFRDGKEAVVDATKACELSHWKNGYAIDTLAAASAEAGDFVRAMAYEHQAFTCENVKKADSIEMGKRLALYQNHKPFHKEKAQ